MEAVAGERPSVVAMFREYAVLERLRSSTGVTPLEYQRWLDLRTRLEAQLPQVPGDRRRFERTPTRLKVGFKSERSLQRAVIRNLSRGGVFVATPFAADVGTSLELLLRIDDTGELVEIPGVVVSSNVSDGISTARMGMGVRFERLDPRQQAWVDALLTASGELASLDASANVEAPATEH